MTAVGFGKVVCECMRFGNHSKLEITVQLITLHHCALSLSSRPPLCPSPLPRPSFSLFPSLISHALYLGHNLILLTQMHHHCWELWITSSTQKDGKRRKRQGRRWGQQKDFNKAQEQEIEKDPFFFFFFLQYPTGI